MEIAGSARLKTVELLFPAAGAGNWRDSSADDRERAPSHGPSDVALITNRAPGRKLRYRTFCRDRDPGALFALVPDIGCELPIVSDFLPHDEIFAGDLLRRGA